MSERQFTIAECNQGSPEWFALRAGLITGTCAHPMLTLEGRKKGEESVARRDLRIRIALEIITQQPQDDGSGFTTDAMKRGSEKEADAVLAYELATGRMVQTCGFLAHTSLRAGCSLDGYVGDFEGILEIKCPKSATHLEYLRSREIPVPYLRQIQHNLFISGAQWADFVSFDDRFPEASRLLVIRVNRDESQMRAYGLALQMFLKEVQVEQAAILALESSGVAA